MAIGYFVWYTPYSGLTKVVASGLLPGADGPIPAFTLLPAAALGTLCAMPVFLALSGWWRYAGRRRLIGLEVPFPARHTLTAGFWMALVMGATTLNYALPGVSILFMLLMMRIARLLISPSMDLVRRREIRAYSWVASGLALVSAVVALSDVDNYRLTLVAAGSLAAYAGGYIGRFTIMSRHAKRGSWDDDRRYMVEEHIAAPMVLVGILALGALIGQGAILQDLRTGFTSFLATPMALPAFAIGILYEGLFICTTLIYIDPREYTYVMPVSVISSLMAGLASSAILFWAFGVPLPSVAQLVSTAIVVLAVAALCYPVVQRTREARRLARLATDTGRPLLLFVCGGNTCRSPMAEAIARVEIAAAARRNGRPVEVVSAGLKARPGLPMTADAVTVLRELGVRSTRHQSRVLTPELIAGAQAVFCMTQEQCEAVLAMAPEAAGKVLRLDPDGDIPDPIGQAIEVYRDCAQRIASQVRERLRPRLYPAPGV